MQTCKKVFVQYKMMQLQSLTKKLKCIYGRFFTLTRKDEDQRNAEITAFLSLDNVEATNKRPVLRIIFV